MLKVKLITYTKDCEKIVAAAAKLCYSTADIDGICEKLDEESTIKFLDRLSMMHHESPFEHMSFTFGIEGVSRSLLAQITRHRLASYSVKSQRYVKEGSFTFVVPPAIEKNEKAKELFLKAMEEDQNYYNEISKLLYEKHYEELINGGLSEKDAAFSAEKAANEDARFVLPNACETKMVATFNARSLFNFFSIRCCNRAQWEIRDLANEMLRLVKEVAPTVFKDCGPNCVRGVCPEGVKTCGKRNEMIKYYKGEK